ncbi:MAG: hypothetical protein UR69_C0003G0137 [Candidatus Moranbacteria bacterium GW2011_GWE2_35_2-]|nr:MAG: hypothetical protein UR69_C0003G0137 [Candidatus Moranbacteria bacterium GW2011_GWE2_35_2-]KKQ29092.1 MAG: hypothetical protein US44_C0003G0004 [Candidatus Moranbacteria bacterium GW2011_GWD1_37_17]KKQ31077.1 MAG: hypothetical protein US47_C0001G0310 [Candidatus Moranbacteria bacterium GW2011_GWE1_37_24]
MWNFHKGARWQFCQGRLFIIFIFVANPSAIDDCGSLTEIRHRANIFTHPLLRHNLIFNRNKQVVPESVRPFKAQVDPATLGQLDRSIHKSGGFNPVSSVKVNEVFVHLHPFDSQQDATISGRDHRHQRSCRRISGASEIRRLINISRKNDLRKNHRQHENKKTHRRHLFHNTSSLFFCQRSVGFFCKKNSFFTTLCREKVHSFYK